MVGIINIGLLLQVSTLYRTFTLRSSPLMGAVVLYYSPYYIGNLYVQQAQET